MKNLNRLPRLGQGAPDADKAFWAFSEATFKDGAIPKKYKELIAVAVGLTTQCGYCIEFHRAAAIAAGATEEEFSELTFVAAAIRAGGAVTHGTHLMPEA